MSGCACDHWPHKDSCPYAHENSRGRHTMNDTEASVLVWCSGHLGPEASNHELLGHLLVCPTCSATVKTADRIVAARVAAAHADAWDQGWNAGYKDTDTAPVVTPNPYRAAVAVPEPEDQP